MDPDTAFQKGLDPELESGPDSEAWNVAFCNTKIINIWFSNIVNYVKLFKKLAFYNWEKVRKKHFLLMFWPPFSRIGLLFLTLGARSIFEIQIQIQLFIWINPESRIHIPNKNRMQQFKIIRISMILNPWYDSRESYDSTSQTWNVFLYIKSIVDSQSGTMVIEIIFNLNLRFLCRTPYFRFRLLQLN